MSEGVGLSISDVGALGNGTMLEGVGHSVSSVGSLSDGGCRVLKLGLSLEGIGSLSVGLSV